MGLLAGRQTVEVEGDVEAEQDGQVDVGPRQLLY